MSAATIERIGVVGCGLMGSGIAEVSARAGLDVMIREVDEAAAEQLVNARCTTCHDLTGIERGVYPAGE